MKTISSTLLMVTIVGGSTSFAQQSRFFVSEQSTLSNYTAKQQLRVPLTQFKIQTPCKRNALVFRLKGAFKIRKEYSTPENFKSVKYFTVRIHPYRIHVKPKQKLL